MPIDLLALHRSHAAHTMNDARSGSSDPSLATIAADWLVAFESALDRRDTSAFAGLFEFDSHWRDILAFTWTIEQRSGSTAIAEALVAAPTEPRRFRLADRMPVPRMVYRVGRRTLEAFFTFATRFGNGSGVLRLVEVPQSPLRWRAWMISTVLDDLANVPHAMPDRSQHGRSLAGAPSQSDREAGDTAGREPTVVVVGAGQAGLAIAARLGALGVDTLVVERNARIGDNWRNRYDALTLHNELSVNHFPYLPFPETWPVYIPKDKLAIWFEIYAKALDISVWTSTTLASGSYDASKGAWTLDLVRDGVPTRVMPKHVVFATGVSAIPVSPALPGLDTFKGKVVHSGEFTTGKDWRGKRVLIVGTGTSAHDIAQDLCLAGADATLIQRSQTYVVSLKQAQKVYALYQDGLPLDACDLLAATTSYPITIRSYQHSTAEMKRADQPLLDRLAARGFRLSDGDADDTGFQMQYMRRGGGYYFNVGCSELIADGRVGLMRWQDVERFCAAGVKMKDGSIREADLIVVATGYKNLSDSVRAYLGDAVADRAGPVWGLDDGGELANMWKRTPQPRLWFSAGSLAQSRIYSKYLALQIKAVELGLIDAVAPPVPANGVLKAEAEVHG